MFDGIVFYYDFLNCLLFLGIDVYWCKCVIKFLKEDVFKMVFDVVIGMVDVVLEIVW